MRVVVIGTGTGIGKTHVGCTLIETWADRGVEAVGLKPVETGVSEAVGSSSAEPEAGIRAGAGAPPAEVEPWASSGLSSDQEQLWKASQLFHVKRSTPSTFHVKRSLYALPEPVSPHLAARQAGAAIDLPTITHWVTQHRAPVVLVETAGGLFSPLTEQSTNLDLVIALQPSVVLLVAPDRLGVLHDVTATMGLAAARGVAIAGLVLSAPEEADASTGRNAAELTRLGIATPIAVFARRAPSDPLSRAAGAAVVDWAERLMG